MFSVQLIIKILLQTVKFSFNLPQDDAIKSTGFDTNWQAVDTINFNNSHCTLCCVLKNWHKISFFFICFIYCWLSYKKNITLIVLTSNHWTKQLLIIKKKVFFWRVQVENNEHYLIRISLVFFIKSSPPKILRFL